MLQPEAQAREEGVRTSAVAVRSQPLQQSCALKLCQGHFHTAATAIRRRIELDIRTDKCLYPIKPTHINVRVSCNEYLI